MPECPSCADENEDTGPACQPSTSRPQLPVCMSKRYHLLDQIITDLDKEQKSDNNKESVGVKLMCDFWNILKNNPNCNLTDEIQRRMCCQGQNPECMEQQNFSSQPLSTYECIMACYNYKSNKRSLFPDANLPDDGLLPLSKVLCNIEEAADYDSKCNEKIDNLMKTQEQLRDQITQLEQREKDGVRMLKETDQMWTKMEAQYRKKLADSQKRQNLLLKELKNLDNNTQKWRKSQRELESEIERLDKVKDEIKCKANQKSSDIQCLDLEIEDLKKRIEDSTKEQKSYSKTRDSKQKQSDALLKKIESEIAKLKKSIDQEMIAKNEKVEKAVSAVHEARTDLQKACETLLQKKLENDDLEAERNALQLEINVFKNTYDSCINRCEMKEASIDEEILKITKEIKQCHGKCVPCHAVTDTGDVQKYCTDCPRCVERIDCVYRENCCADRELDCICMTVKKKFLDNIFENMYIVLEKEINTKAGKALADTVAKSLNNSKNGKIDASTRKTLQDFILSVVKKNLDLTIVGGAVKTRCEMDQDTYDQLMLCLKDVKITNSSKEDKNLPTRKDPCGRWGGTNECNCPNGPKDCVCSKKAPPSPKKNACDKQTQKSSQPRPRRPQQRRRPDSEEMASWIPKPCERATCKLANMKAAQCVLGRDKLNTNNKSDTCSICEVPMSECTCHKDKGRPEPQPQAEEKTEDDDDDSASSPEKVKNSSKVNDPGAKKMDSSRADCNYCDCNLVAPKDRKRRLHRKQYEHTCLPTNDKCYCGCSSKSKYKY